MRSYQVVHGVDIKNTNGLPVITRIDDDDVMGNATELTVYLKPDYSNVSADKFSVRNMAQFRTHAESEGAFNVDNGLFEIYQNSLLKNVGGPINPDAWTLFFIKGPGWVANDQLVQRVIMGASGNESDIALNVAISQNGVLFRVFETEERTVEGAYRLPEVDVSLADRASPSLFTLTFSTKYGMQLRDGGQIVSQSDDKRPLGTGFGANDYQIFYACRGSWGELGIVNADLSAPENEVLLKSIENFLMGLHGIPAGPQ
ncbi:hypothetical protein NDQ72_01470 [Halomonas sp. KG2]|uniref:hypothetical protein n=1 Tax=Halomonas sp. KG2 TaxID=2951138 RepID=UPI002649F807|nr:hypothetical protein [Halomonas sp. KG2]WKD28644.1 hypothetical protein NDQ72_01470 [Halomonas sp. KG2]